MCGPLYTNVLYGGTSLKVDKYLQLEIIDLNLIRLSFDGYLGI